MKTVSIISGWAEGQWQYRNFKQGLEKSGFHLVADPSIADIIVAHSAGCYFLPKDTKAKLIILIGLPFWPGQPLIISLAQKLWWEINHHRRNKDLGWWLGKMSHNIWYIFSKPQLSFRYIVNRWNLNLPVSIEGRSIILLRNTDDSFCHPEIQKILPATTSYSFVEFPGSHDDCWINPKPYIDLLLKEI